MKLNANNRYSELLKNTSALAVANFSSKILIFLLIPLYTRILTTAEYGFYDLVYTTIQLLAPVFTLNVADGILRFTLDKNNDIGQIINIVIKYVLLSIIPASIVLIIFFFTDHEFYIKKYWLLIWLYYLGYVVNQAIPQIAKGIDRVSDMAVSGVIGTVVTVVFCAIFLFYFKMGLYGFFLAYSLGQIIPSVFLFFKLKIYSYISLSSKINRNLEKCLLAYSVPLILNSIGWWLNNTSDRYITTFFSGVSVNGLLSVAYKIPSILSVLYQVFSTAWQISAIKEYEKKDSDEFYNSTFIYFNIIVYYLAAILIISNKYIARIAFANDFYEAWIYVPFLLISSVFTASSGFIAPILSSTYRTKPIALSTVVGGVVNIIINIILINSIGPQGVAIATAISSFIIMYIRYKAVNTIIRKEVFGRLLILWVLLVIQAVSEIYNIYVIEIATIIISFLFFYKNIFYILNKGISTLTNKSGDK